MQKSKAANFAAVYDGTFGLMFAGVVLYLAALPPLNLWWLGWLVAACWTPLLRRKTLLSEELPTQIEKDTRQSKKTKRMGFRGRPYRQI